MGAVVWNANVAGGGGGTTVRVLSDEIPLARNTAVEVGDAICTVLVDALEVGDTCVVGYSGCGYASGDPGIQLYVDGVAWSPTTFRTDLGGVNAYLNSNFVLVVAGLAAGDHSFEVRNAGNGPINFMPDPANLPGTGATLVVTVVAAPS